MNQLVKYDTACRAVAAALSVDEARKIRGDAEMMRAYGRQAKDLQIETNGAEIRIRAERRIGQLMQGQRETVGLAKGGQPYQSTGGENPPVGVSTLADAGIDKDLAKRARKLAAIPESEFTERIDDWRSRIALENERVTIDLLAAGDAHIRGTFGTGENEWHTPPEYIDAARDVMGGIDLDPASSKVAQGTVKAKRFFTKSENGLTKAWKGRIWLNPPYAQPHIADFITKAVEEIAAGNVSSAIILTHNYTDTAWFQEAQSQSRAICFTRGRIRFVGVDGTLAAPTQGQAFFYYGDDVKSFRAKFVEFGFVVRPV